MLKASPAAFWNEDGSPVYNVSAVFSSAANDVVGTKLIVTFANTKIDGTVTAGKFTVLYGAAAQTVSAVTLDGKTIALTVPAPLGTDTITVEYAGEAGNNVTAFTAQPVTNNVPV